MNPGAPSGLDIIVGVVIAAVGLVMIACGIGAIADRQKPQFIIGFIFLLVGCIVIAIGAKAMGFIR